MRCQSELLRPAIFDLKMLASALRLPSTGKQTRQEVLDKPQRGDARAGSGDRLVKINRSSETLLSRYPTVAG
jgi:hypothetical protein